MSLYNSPFKDDNSIGLLITLFSLNLPHTYAFPFAIKKCYENSSKIFEISKNKKNTKST